MKYSYVLWIPSTEEGCPEIIENCLQKISLRDNEQYTGIVLIGSIDDEYRIDICYYFSNDTTERHLYFRNEIREESGFMVYSLLLPDDSANDDFFIQNLRQEMPTALYHYIKSFFHEHINHDSEADSKLKAYVSSDEHFDFERDRTLVLNTVFGSYEDLFCGQAKIVRKELREALDSLSNDKNKFRNLNILDRLAVSTNNVLGEIPFCEFLLSRSGQYADNELCSKIRRSINVLKDYQRQLLFWNNHFHSRFSYADGLSGVRWGVTGVIVSCISLTLTFILPLFDTSEERIVDVINSNSSMIEKKLQNVMEHPQKPSDSLSIHTSRKTGNK